jgi:hypothetical protein
MQKKLLPLDELIRLAWPLLNPVQRLALLLKIFGCDLLNRIERVEVIALTFLAFVLNVILFRGSLPPEHVLTPFVTLGTAFYSATVLFMVATWPTRRRVAHWVK